MISVDAYHGEGVTHVDDPADISDWVAKDGCLVWVDVIEPDDDDLACIQEEFELHPLAIEDASKHGQRPKIEQYPTHAFVVAYSEERAEVDLFVGPNWLVMVRERSHDGRYCSVDNMKRRFERTRDGTGVGFLLYTILDEIVDGYFDALDESEDVLEALEERIFADEQRDESSIQAEMFKIRRDLMLFRRLVVPLRDVLQVLLRREVPWIDDRTVLHVQDVYDHLLRTVDQLDSQRELLGNAVDAHLALMSNRMNSVMKRMTSWGAILLGSTLIAGIYGMNFEHMPELDWYLGYPLALGMMVILTAILHWYFSRKDWL